MELIKVIHEELPQIQCGRCDTPGCYQYAEAIAQGEAHNRCVPGGEKTLKNLNNLLNKNIEEIDFDYGPSINNQTAIINEEECIGCKKCITACPVDAICGSVNLMHNIIEDLCTGCELCIEPCPVDCIELVKSENDQSRKDSQYYFNLTEELRNQETKKRKMDKSFIYNQNIGDEINIRINNRNIDTDKNIINLQLKILENQLDQYHSLSKKDRADFIKKNK